LIPREPVAPIAEEVCRALQEKRSHIQDECLRILQSEVGPNYAIRPAEELRDTTTQAVAAYLAALCTGDWEPMGAFVQEIAEKRFPLRFPLSEVQKAFGVFRFICSPILAGAFQGEKLNQALEALDLTVDQAINRFSDTYQRLHLEEIQNKSAELAEAHRVLERQFEELTDAARIRSQFFANMSHELRSPLNSIIGYTELLLDGIDGPLTDAQRPNLQKVLASARYLMKLINNILDTTKIESGHMEIEPRPFDVRSLVAEALDTVAPLAYRKRISPRVEIPEDAGAFVADAEKIKEVLINLLANAVKFTDEGEVVCSVRRGPGRLFFEVHDTGIGIRAEDLGKIFDKFFQADVPQMREHRGTGLGLPLSKMLVELMGGEIGVESEVGRGSRFSFWVPEALPKTERAALAEGAPERPRIVVVEDDPSALELIQKVLENEGMEAIPASSSEEGLKLVRSVHPSAITLDIRMPNVDGWQVLSELKADASTRDIPVLVLSCVDERERGLREGAEAYLVKPLDRRSLAGSLRRILARQGDGAQSSGIRER
jgi:signal transduction histidine kinase/CheY-like chemotaxis protein